MSPAHPNHIVSEYVLDAAAKARLLAHYDAHARDLPWRAAPGRGRADPYRVWLSEIMLQQTTVKAVIPYFKAFMDRWPRVEDLAAAGLDAVLEAWAGLGYYRRARLLHACAVEVATRRGGRFPETAANLRALPGVGDYTAAAIAAIAFGEDIVPVDGNIERVTARVFAIDAPLPQAKGEIARAAQAFAGSGRPGDMAQALMDLGAGVCTPKTPDCPACPLNPHCRARAEGLAASLPKKAAKKAQKKLRTAVFVLRDSRGWVLMRRRPEEGVLAGLWEVPGSPWASEVEDASAHEPLAAEWARAGEITHVFTHIRLAVEIYVADLAEERTNAPPGCVWRDPAAGGLPTLTVKILRAAGVMAG